MGGWLRNFWRGRLLNQWSARDSYPRQIRRRYGSADECAKDRARLTAHGYRVVDEAGTGLTYRRDPDASRPG